MANEATNGIIHKVTIAGLEVTRLPAKYSASQIPPKQLATSLNKRV